MATINDQVMFVYSMDNKSCMTIHEEHAQPLMAGHDVVPRIAITYAIPHNIIGRSDTAGGNGKQYMEEVSYTLDSRGDAPAVATSDRTGQPEVSGTLFAAYGTKWNGNGGADSGDLLHCQQYAVRRLTPVECERLQGFPDGWTQIAYKGKAKEDCPDGPRYKALGNSMAVPVMRWIGERIQKIENDA